MANIPKRPLDFDRVTRTEKIKEKLAEITLRRWSKIFGWDKNQSAGSPRSTRPAKK
jgi:hypothetical protein